MILIKKYLCILKVSKTILRYDQGFFYGGSGSTIVAIEQVMQDV